MKKKFNLILAAMLSAFSVSAFDVITVAGGLEAAIGEDLDATSIAITGEMNAADFEFLNNSMRELSLLDLSGVKIVAYDGVAVITERQSYPADMLPHYALMGSNISTLVLPSGLKVIGDGALADTKLATIEIPATVTTIGMGAFSGCDRLTSIVIPATVTSVGDYAFMGCSALTSVAIAGVSEIGVATFARCDQLSTVSLPAALTGIGNRAFNGCGSLTALTFGTGLKRIGSEAFQSTGLVEVDLSACAALDTIGDWAFAGCDALTRVVLPDNLSSVGRGAFFDDANLAALNIPSSCDTISDYMLKGTVAIDSSSVANSSVDAIGAYALMGWTHVPVFNIPGSVTYIGDNAFEGWSSLYRLCVDNLASVPELGAEVWRGLDQPNIKLVAAVDMVNAFGAAEQWKEFDITNIVSVEEVIGDAESAIKARFNGFDIEIEASCEIAEVRLFDSSGRQYTYETPCATRYVISTADWSCRLYILNVTLTDGTIGAVKLARWQ